MSDMTATSILNVLATINTWGIKNQSEEAKYGWAAGFIDGDGCISAVTQKYQNRNRDSVRIRIDVIQNDLTTLETLRETLGEKGHINPVKRQECHNRQVYQLTFDGRHAINVIMKVGRFLVRKSHEAQACLKLWTEGMLYHHPGRRGTSDEIQKIRLKWVRKIKRLK